MRTLIISALALTLFACNNGKQEITKKISTNTGKYWDVRWAGNVNEEISSANASPAYCYYFDHDGKYRIYIYKEGRRVLYDGGDVEIPEIWSYLTDSTIMIATANYKIEKLTSDTFIYSSPQYGRTFLVKSQEQSRGLDTIIDPAILYKK